MDLVLTHSDLDGIGCALIIKIYNKLKLNKNTDVKFIGHSSFKYIIKEIDFKKYDNIFITDFTPNFKDYSYIKKINKNIKIFDHHEYNQEYKNENFIHQIEGYDLITNEKRIISATNIVFNNFKIDNELIENKLRKISNNIDKYDIYQFKEEDLSRKLELTRKFLGNEDFLDKLYMSLYNLRQGNYYYEELLKTINFIYKYENKKIEEDLDRIKKGNFISGNIYINDKYIRFIMVNKPLDHNKVAEELLNNTDTEAVIINYDNKRVSIRTRDDSRVSALELGKMFNAKGHKNACGGFFTKQATKQATSLLLMNNCFLD